MQEESIYRRCLEVNKGKTLQDLTDRKKFKKEMIDRFTDRVNELLKAEILRKEREAIPLNLMEIKNSFREVQLIDQAEILKIIPEATPMNMRPGLQLIKSRLKRKLRLKRKRRDGFREAFRAEILKKKREETPVIQLKNFEAIVDGVNSNDTELNLRAAVQLRKYLLSDRGDPISKVVGAGVVPRFVEFLGTEAPPQLQFEALQVLRIIAGGTSEQTKTVVEHGAVSRIVGLLASKDIEVREQAIWALNNIASQSPRFRDVVLEEGAMGPLLEHFVMFDARLSMLRHVAGAIRSFCGALPRPVFKELGLILILGTLARLLHAKDEEVLQDACWALSYLSDGKSEKVKYVIAAGVCGKLVDLIQQPDTAIVFPALSTLCHIAAGGSEEQIKVLASHGCVQPLCALLHYGDEDVLMVTLEVINNLLKVSESMVMPNTSAAASMLAEVISKAGGFGKLNLLKWHDNKDIREKAEQILKQHYWPSEELMLQVVER